MFGMNRYPFHDQLEEALAKHHDVPMEMILVGVGSSEILNLLVLAAFWDRGGNIVTACNTLIDPDWRLWAIDSSRSFRTKKDFVDDTLDHFSRAVLANLRALDFDTLKEHLGDYVDDGRIKAILARRDLIVEPAAELAAERGEGAVLVP